MDPITQSWLHLQCQYSRHIRRALVLLGTPGGDDSQPMATWPADEPVDPSLQSIAEQLLSKGREKPWAKTVAGDKGSIVACPIIAGGQCFGLVVVSVAGSTAALQRQTARALQWGCEWFTWLARERRNSRDQDSHLLGFIEVLALALKFEDFHQSVQAIADAMRGRLDCARVCIGMMELEKALPVALSGSRPGENIRAVATPIQSAMEEASDQQATVYFGEGAQDVGLVTHAHRKLAADHQLHSVCSIPMIHNGEVVAVVTFENLKVGAFDQAALQFWEQMALLLGPILALKAKSSRLSGRRVFNIKGRTKSIAGAIALIVIGLCFIPGSYNISTSAVVESDKKQLLLSAIDGFVASASARPGDQVKTGEVLARLDDRDLKLEQQKWLGKQAQLTKSYNNALSSLDRAEINIVKAKLNQAKAQLSLLANQLQRTKIIAPFDGVIVSGDLSQSLGAPVKRGDLLYEIAPKRQYRLLLKVDERDVVRLATGQVGSVRLSSLPDRSLEFKISKITPVSTMAEGQNYFDVEARFHDVDITRLSPGMTGVAKVHIGERAYMWIWFHRGLDWLQFWYWRI